MHYSIKFYHEFFHISGTKAYRVSFVLLIGIFQPSFFQSIRIGTLHLSFCLDTNTYNTTAVQTREGF